MTTQEFLTTFCYPGSTNAEKELNLIIAQAIKKHLSSIKDLPLPKFLYESDDEIVIGYQGDSICTDEWNEWLNKTINEPLLSPTID